MAPMTIQDRQILALSVAASLHSYVARRALELFCTKSVLSEHSAQSARLPERGTGIRGNLGQSRAH